MNARSVGLFAIVVVLAAPTALAELVETEAKIKNKDPTITSIVPHDDVPGAAGYQIQPVAGGAKTVAVTLTVDDGNGKEDVASLTLQVKRPDGSTLHEAVSATPTSGQGTVRHFSASFAMQFHEPPGTYEITASVVDTKGGRGTGAQSFDYEALLAFDPSPRSVGFSSSALEPATSSPAAGVSIRNLGNVPLDVHVSGTDMEASDADAEIGVERVKYGLDDDLDDATPLARQPVAIEDFDLAPGANSRRSLWFRVDVPSGEEQFIPADTYQGSITIGAGVSS